jgi:hypothetical protein
VNSLRARLALEHDVQAILVVFGIPFLQLPSEIPFVLEIPHLSWMSVSSFNSLGKVNNGNGRNPSRLPKCFVGFRAGWPRRAEAKKTAGGEKQKRYSRVYSIPGSGNGRREQLCSMVRAGKQDKIRPWEKCFFSTSLL